MIAIFLFITCFQQHFVEGKIFNVCKHPVLTGDSGELASPGYPSKYGNNLNCTSTIKAQPNKTIEVTFIHLNIRSGGSCHQDKLLVYDGNILFTGKPICGHYKPANLMASHGDVTVTFQSDFHHSKTGFLLQWTQLWSTCGPSFFACSDGSCIVEDKKCDGVRDCEDDSDETQCAHHTTSNKECGKQAVAPNFTPFDLRIVGGNQAEVGSWPWQALLVDINGVFICGASIIQDSWVVTAAHCTESSRQLLIAVGLHRFSQKSGYTVHRVAQVVQHEHYSSKTLVNDISLLRLEHLISFSTTVRPVCLPNVDQILHYKDVSPGTYCVASGWGSLSEEREYPDSLQQVQLPIIENKICKGVYKNFHKGHICAGNFNEGGIDTCQGDSGGPLVCLLNETSWYLVGVTSYGDGCARKRLPGVYTRVSRYANWITSKITP